MWKRIGNAALGATVGMAIGFIFFGPPGAVVGAKIGGAIGGGGGDGPDLS